MTSHMFSFWEGFCSVLPKRQSQKCLEDCFSGRNEQGCFPSSCWGLPDKPTLFRCFHPLADTEGKHRAAAKFMAVQKAKGGKQRGAESCPGSEGLTPGIGRLPLASPQGARLSGERPLCQAGVEKHHHLNWLI